MASTCSATFGEADYGCGSNGSLQAQFTCVPTGWQHDPNIPDQAQVLVNVTSTFTVSNVKYSTTTDQDISAWVAFNSESTPLVESVKTFVPREDCTTTTNSIVGNTFVNVSMGNTIRFKGKWSGIDGSQIGVDIPGCDWQELTLSDDYRIFAPQNLQVTFPDELDGNIQASIESWGGENNLITGVPFTPATPSEDLIYNSWNWKVELIDTTGSVVGVNEYVINSLTANLQAPAGNLVSNAAYRIRVTASNEYQQTVSATSPVIYSKPAAPMIRQVTFDKAVNNTFTAHISWAKPRGGEGFEETVVLSIPNILEETTIAVTQNGESLTGVYDVAGLQPGVLIPITISTTSSMGRGESTGNWYVPAIPPTISLSWNSDRSCLIITPTSPNITNFLITAGTQPNSSDLYYEWKVTSAEVCDINDLTGSIYISAVPISQDTYNTFVDYVSYATSPILHTILGVVKTCDETRNVVDLVENHGNGWVGESWRGGKRAVILSECNQIDTTT